MEPHLRYSHVLAAISTEPRTFAEALRSPNTKQWTHAIEEEIGSFFKNDTWDLEPLPIGRQVVKSKWVYKLKYDNNGCISRYKARLVAKGYSQTPDIDFGETFSPVNKHDSIRSMLAIAVAHDMHIM